MIRNLKTCPKKKSDLWHAHNIIFCGVNTRRKSAFSLTHKIVAIFTSKKSTTSSTIIGSIKLVFCNMFLPFGSYTLSHLHVFFPLSSKSAFSILFCNWILESWFWTFDAHFYRYMKYTNALCRVHQFLKL